MVEAPGRRAGRARQARGVLQLGRALQGARAQGMSVYRDVPRTCSSSIAELMLRWWHLPRASP